ncbi:MAG: LacI family DNA-binding transcriptional regulator [Oscillibacter sp.]
MADNEAGAAIAVRYLLQLGHRDLVFLGGRADSLTRVQRVRGFRRALREHGLSGRVLPRRRTPGNCASGPMNRRWHCSGADAAPRRAGIFRPDRPQNFGGGGRAGIRVPEDLSLVGYDNVSYAAIPRIHLTTVSQHKFQQGRIAVERLLCQIQGDRRPTADLLQPELVVRSTCAPRTQGGRTL